jgi:hypothetical protein
MSNRLSCGNHISNALPHVLRSGCYRGDLEISYDLTDVWDFNNDHVRANLSTQSRFLNLLSACLVNSESILLQSTFCPLLPNSRSISRMPPSPIASSSIPDQADFIDLRLNPLSVRLLAEFSLLPTEFISRVRTVISHSLNV